MPKLKLVFLSAFLLCLSLSSVEATQTYMNAYNSYKYKSSAWVNRCDLCHVSSGGGGTRNSFGTYYEMHGHSFSQSMMSAFPTRFTDPSNFIANVSWSVAVTNLTPTVEGALDVSLSSAPSNAGSTMSYKIVASKAVQKYITLSSTTGTISLDPSIGTDTITVFPRAILSTAKMQSQLAKKPLTLSLTLIPLNNDGSSATSEKGTVTINVVSD